MCSKLDTSYFKIVPDPSTQNARLLDLILHPRLPPLLRSLPALDAIALWHSEEGSEERKTRELLGLRSDMDGNIVDEGARDQGPTHDVRQFTNRPNPDPAPQKSVVEHPAPPVMIPAAPFRLATPILADPSVATDTTLAQTLQAGVESVASNGIDAPSEVAKPKTPPKPEEGREISVVQQPDPLDTQQQPPRPDETSQMVVDDDDEDEDIEMPVLDPASPTDSEVE